MYFIVILFHPNSGWTIRIKTSSSFSFHFLTSRVNLPWWNINGFNILPCDHLGALVLLLERRHMQIHILPCLRCFHSHIQLSLEIGMQKDIISTRSISRLVQHHLVDEVFQLGWSVGWWWKLDVPLSQFMPHLPVLREINTGSYFEKSCAKRKDIGCFTYSGLFVG